MTKDYYKILNVGKDARDEDIKKAYHTLALKYHPDKNKDPAAEQYFKEILEAYQVLSDKKRRLNYDKFEYNNSKSTKSEFSSWTNPYAEFGTSQMNLEDLLELLTKIGHGYSNLFGMMRHEASTQAKEPPVEYDLYVTLEELNSGVTKRVKFKRAAFGGLRMEVKKLEVKIPPGCKTGSKMRFFLKGDAPGDVIIVVREKKHKYFQRFGDDLKFVADIPRRLALTGNFFLNVPTIEGEIVQVNIKDRVINQGTIKYIRQKGLPNCMEPNKRGNLLIEVNIKYP